MGVINKTTEEINTLLDKVEGMPEEGVVGKTPVLETGTTTTLEAGSEATSEVVANGTDESGNPKYKLNFGIPKGYDGSGGSGGGGTADSVQWANVLNKPSWVNSSTKPSYTAAEVGALPAETTIPSKTSELDNDSKFVKRTELKTINGNSIVGPGNIEISGTGSGIADAPSDGQTYGRKNGAWASIASSTGGSVDISDLISRIAQIAEIGGTCTDEDYSTLKGYADNGIVTYINSEGTSLIVDTKNFSGNIILSYSIEGESGISFVAITIVSSKRVTITQKNILQDTNIGSGLLGGYTKPASYSAISKEDSISTAIGKLEAGLGIGGSSSDDEFYLPGAVYRLTSGATATEITDAFGGDEGIQAFKNAMNENKKIYLKCDESYIKALIPVSYEIAFNALWGISFRKDDYGSASNSAMTLRINPTRVYSMYDGGYALKASFYGLTSSSTTEEISTAVGGENGMKKLIQAIIDSNRIYIDTSEEFQQKTSLLCNLYSVDDNGDMSVLLWGFGYSLWGHIAGAIQIQYTKSSNTFSAEVTNLN